MSAVCWHGPVLPIEGLGGEGAAAKRRRRRALATTEPVGLLGVARTAGNSRLVYLLRISHREEKMVL
jgi:hypothetical protein